MPAILVDTQGYVYRIDYQPGRLASHQYDYLVGMDALPFDEKVPFADVEGYLVFDEETETVHYE